MKTATARRSDGRCDTTDSFVHHLLTRRPRLAYDPEFTSSEFGAWKRQVKRRLRKLLAFPRMPSGPRPKLLGEQSRDGYTLQKWEFFPEPHCVVPFLALVPHGATAKTPVPAVLCFPGSEQPKESLCGERWSGPWVNRFGEHNQMALHFVKAGFAAFAFDNPATCEVSGDRGSDWRRQSEHLIWLGRSYEGVSVFQKMVALDWILTRRYVDSDRIAACGHSLGAKPALLMGILSDRVRAVIWNDNAHSWRHRITSTNMQPVAPWHYVPDFAIWFDYLDLWCALAPTPLLITEGGYLRDLALVRGAYKRHGRASDFAVTFMPKFRSPAKRCRKKMPENVDMKSYSKYANYDTDHYFKEDVALPWLLGKFNML